MYRIIALWLVCSAVINVCIGRKTRINPVAGTACEDDYLCESGECIPLDWVCDQYGDCVGGEDEEDCEEFSCPDDTHACGTGSGKTCIPMSWTCDGTLDCADGSDESICGVTEEIPMETEAPPPPVTEAVTPPPATEAPPPPATEAPGPTCDDDEFGCIMKNSWKCIPENWVCDGEEDCAAGEDEDSDMCDTDCSVCEVCSMVLEANMALYGFNDEVVDNLTEQGCQDACVAQTECLSLDYTQRSGRCYLSRDSQSTQPDHFGPHHGSNYYGKSCVMDCC